MSESPDAMRKRNIALARPLSSWTRSSDILPPHSTLWGESWGEGTVRLVPRTHLLHFVVGGQHLLAGDVLVIDHDADAARRIDLRRTHPRTHGGLAVYRAER